MPKIVREPDTGADLVPWVPRDLYDLMLDALRESRASAAVGTPFAPPVEAPPVSKPPAVTAPAVAVPDVALPRAVEDAIALYAFGDPVEQAANYHRAIALQQAGKSAAEIVRDLRQGANPETFV
jgi:hypothetical protein